MVKGLGRVFHDVTTTSVLRNMLVFCRGRFDPAKKGGTTSRCYTRPLRLVEDEFFVFTDPLSVMS